MVEFQSCKGEENPGEKGKTRKEKEKREYANPGRKASGDVNVMYILDGDR